MSNRLDGVVSLKRKRSMDDVDIRMPGENTNPRKVVGRTNPRPRRRQQRGSLHLLPQMPMDIIYEVSKLMSYRGSPNSMS